ALFLPHPSEAIQLVADGRPIRRFAGARGARAASDARAALGGTVLGTEGSPEPGTQLAPAIDLGPDRLHLGARSLDHGLLLCHLRAEDPESGTLLAEGEIVGVDDGHRDGQRDHEGQHGEDQPSRERETSDAPPVTMNHEEVELAASPHPPQRLRGTTESSRAGISSALGWAFVIRQCPSNSTPSPTTPSADP